MKRPHILLITTDEQHRSTLSCYGASTHTTNAIDAFAKEATVYEKAYTVSPVCLPARCSIMTGLYPHNSGSVSNDFGSSLSRQLPNLFTELKKEGYKTSLHGKCHFIPVPYPAVRPDMTLEYEHFITYYKSLGIDTLNLQDDKNNSLWYYDDYSKELAKKNMLKRCRYDAHQNPENPGFYDFPFEDDMHPDAWTANKALEYLENIPDDGKPEFMWVSFSGPHYPVDTPRKYTDRIDPDKMEARIYQDGEWDDESKYHYRGYNGPGGGTEGCGPARDHAQKNYTEEYWTEWRRRYLGNIALIDEKVGQIIEHARKRFGDNLMIIYTTDHGEMMGNHSLWGKNGSLFEDVLRIPLLIQNPGQKKGKRVDAVISSLELFPTILDAAGIQELPTCDGLPVDTMVEMGGRQYIISECDNTLAILQDGMKLELNRAGLRGRLYKEFYNLHTDPHEFENKFDAPEYQNAIKELMGILESFDILLPTIMRDPDKDGDYWLNYGEGAGLSRNRE